MISKKYDYFDGFIKVVSLIKTASIYLTDALKTFKYENFELCVIKMHKIENQADSLKHEMIKNLSHEFITPIEREDIVALAQELDNVVDSIDDIIGKIYIYNVKTIKKEIFEFTTLINDAANVLETVVVEFKNFRKSQSLSQNIIKVNTIENQGDSLRFKYMRKLYEEEKDSKTVYIWTMIFDSLEQCFDACEHAADVIESVTMKNT